MEKKMTLSDDAIVTIAKILQVGILTGTDIVDNLRLVELVLNDSGALDPSDEFLENFDQNIEKMLNGKNEQVVNE